MDVLRVRGRILVTGAAGFLGSHLVDRLLAEDREIVGFDNLSSGVNWIAAHIERGRLTFRHADLLDRDAVCEAMRGVRMVFHLGGNTDIPAGLRDPDLDVRHAVLATRNVLEGMRRHGVPWLVFTSSGAVYGKAVLRPTPETYGPLLPLSLYGAGKLACEALISAYCSMFGLRARIFRLGNAIGSRMGHSAIVDFVRKLSQSTQELEILGDGTSEKNYFLVEECIDGMLFVIEHAFSDDDPACDMYNLGTSSSASVMTIVHTLLDEMGLRDVPLRFTGGEQGWPGDQAHIYLDVTKVGALGWAAKHTSEEAIRIAIRRYLGKEESPCWVPQETRHGGQA